MRRTYRVGECVDLDQSRLAWDGQRWRTQQQNRIRLLPSLRAISEMEQAICWPAEYLGRLPDLLRAVARPFARPRCRMGGGQARRLCRYVAAAPRHRLLDHRTRPARGPCTGVLAMGNLGVPNDLRR
jgi:hypothetical protein